MNDEEKYEWQEKQIKYIVEYIMKKKHREYRNSATAIELLNEMRLIVRRLQNRIYNLMTELEGCREELDKRGIKVFGVN